MSRETEALTWAALLAKWTEFAKSAVALPTEGEGGKLRRAVPALIGLQAVTHALAELDRLPRDERAVGLDRASILITKYTGELTSIWSQEPPPEVAELASDARHAWDAAAQALV
jgi:hypothetical protein